MLPRILYLDGLRGLLALVVFFHHFLYIYFPEVIFGGTYSEFSLNTGYSGLKWIALTPANIFFNPGFAIHFFFLLSGYVQTRAFYQSGNLLFIQRSLLKRYLRLALPVLCTVLLVFCAHKFQLLRKELIPNNILNADWLKSLLPNTLSFPQVFKEGLLSCFQRNSRYYQVLWTMPTELANSYLVLLLVLALHQLRHQTLLVLVVMAIQFFILKEYYSIAFVTGMLLARLNAEETQFAFFCKKIWARLLFLVAGLYFGSYPFTGFQGAVLHSIYAPSSFFETYPHIISYFVGTTFLFLFLLQSERLQNFLSLTVFLFYGRISFMLYLLHFLVLLTVTPLLEQALHNLLLSLISTLVFATALAWLFTKYIDEPVIRLSNGWAQLFIKK